MFRVELTVDDGNDSVTFVVSDREMTKLTNFTPNHRNVSSPSLHTYNISFGTQPQSGGSNQAPFWMSKLENQQQLLATPLMGGEASNRS
ncbi:hypothetical protein F2Q70_00036629 [Brassica cretica]|uniref:Uncharacterized protein n=1 Tax=Brassica cretica TaxID=69181 RepID=A0A8S9JRF1_BRACR|nr:hypothetical protein F2Q70_00036629 [Brassica cretica]